VGLDVYDDMLAAMGWGYTDVVGSLPEQSIGAVSGHEVGHIGPADIIVGFDRLRRAGQLGGVTAAPRKERARP
jgi:hypothetical protein